jgi:beta-N-acetylglucosaminidase
MSFTTFEQADREAKKREAKRNPFASEMSMRDYFAAKAMQGFMANKSNPMHYQPETDAQWAYTIADAMLKARET